MSISNNDRAKGLGARCDGPPSRRDFLKLGAGAGALALTSGTRVFGQPLQQRPDAVLVIFLRGGADGLGIVSPFGDDELFNQRPALALSGSDVINLDGFYGLNASAGPLYRLFAEGELAFVHACGSLNPTRSHFEAMRRIEQAAIFGGNLPQGYLARHLDDAPPFVPGGGRAVAIDRTLPTVMQGADATLPIPKLADFTLGGPLATRSSRMDRLRAMLEASPEPERSAGLTTLSLVSALSSIDFETRPTDGGAIYPATKFGQGLYEAATLLKSGVGIEAVEVDFGGWDHHQNLGPTGDGRLARMLRELSMGLLSFRADMGSFMKSTTVLVLSEFGRRVDMNGSLGTDHGRGGVAMVMGGPQVNGGQVYGTWPGLTLADQDDRALAVTTDIRDVISEILVKRLQTPNIANVLPNYTPQFLGILN